MTTSVLVLGAGFGGLELSSRLSQRLGDQVQVTLIDRADAFVFGFISQYLALTTGAAALHGPAYAEGGIIPGPLGRAQLIIAHGGEAVLTPAQQAMLGRGDVYTFNINASSTLDLDRLEQALNRSLGRNAKLAERMRR